MTKGRLALGLSEYLYRQKQERSIVWWDPDTLINGHVMFCGMSGTGKTYQSMRFLNWASQRGLQVDVMDVHEELETIQDAKAVKYSQSTQYGYNPLVLDTDPHSGGVNRQADFILGLVRQVSTQFGAKQEAALRNAIIDCYFSRGIYPDNPRSWVKKQISEDERRQLIADRKWSDLRNYYPTLQDLFEFIDYKIRTLVIGGNNKVHTLLDITKSAWGALETQHKKMGKSALSSDTEEKEKVESRFKAALERWRTAFDEYVTAGPGRELQDMIKYDSADVLISVRQRLEILAAAGIFNAKKPPFGDAKVRVHQIKSLSTPQQVFFVKLRLQAIFDECKRLGPTASGTEVRHVVFLDEAPKYFTEEDDDILNIIAREGRKFGLVLWCAAQEPTSFPQAFITNCGTKILLGIDSSFWKGTISKMRATEDTLKYTKAKEVIAVKLHVNGKADPPFTNVMVPNDRTYNGKIVVDELRKAA